MATLDVLGIDHIYLAVSDLAASERFYDGFMGTLGFRKNTFTNDGDPHVQYYNRHFGIVLRPAAGTASGPGPGLHHLCLRVDTVADVDAVATALEGLGIVQTPARLYPQYAPDYYALHLRDPDGIHLEITNYRRERRERHDRWDALQD
jgi:catechol 2,3-dioxygenase-like lactoylglutathione lyase family enzyme